MKPKTADIRMKKTARKQTSKADEEFDALDAFAKAIALESLRPLSSGNHRKWEAAQRGRGRPLPKRHRRNASKGRHGCAAGFFQASLRRPQSKNRFPQSQTATMLADAGAMPPKIHPNCRKKRSPRTGGLTSENSKKRTRNGDAASFSKNN